MKTHSPEQSESAAIVQSLDLHGGAADATPEAEAAELERARAFAEPLLRGRLLDTGEEAFAHAAGLICYFLSPALIYDFPLLERS